ncbi:MAG: hypothetical protein Q9191_005671 [Dirinaria sp. TL-2023a]
MAPSSQFSLSVELTKLIPLGPLASIAGKSIVQFIRELQASGSDIVTEEGLAEVFGRNRIDSRFESTFRTAVRQSAIHHVADIAELVIEGGPGPTVRRSLKDPIYFRTIVQLSLLTWAHELNQFAKALAQALDRRATENGQAETPPRLDGLKGTLRAVREQTSGFMWELIFSAVDEQLEPLRRCETKAHMRLLPVSILQALLDALTAVQNLPEARLLKIRSIDGITTIVVWAHFLLGLTVVVESQDGASERFGKGPESVYVDCGNYNGYDDPYANASLFNETDDLLFNIDQSSADSVLAPGVRRHQLLGFRLKLVTMNQGKYVLIQSLVHAAITSAISLVKEELTTNPDVLRRLGKHVYPSSQKILAVACLLFPGYERVIDTINPEETYPCLVRSAWTLAILPEQVVKHITEGECTLKDFRTDTRRLTHMILMMALVHNIENCSGLALDYLCAPKLEARFGLIERSTLGEEAYKAKILKDWTSPLLMPTASEAFGSMSLMMMGQDFLKHEEDLGTSRIAVISTWGWTLCTSSIVANDPSNLYPGLSVFQGVPMRKGERRRLICDSGLRNPWPYKAENRRRDELGRFRAIAGPGETKTLSTWTRSKQTKYSIATTEDAFEILKVYQCRSFADPQSTWEVRVGFHDMQSIYWNFGHLPPCEHDAGLDAAVTLPENTWAFEGFTDVELGPQAGQVYVALLAGDKAARWIMTKTPPRYVDEVPNSLANMSSPIFLRPPECCFECAISMVRNANLPQAVLLIL